MAMDRRPNDRPLTQEELARRNGLALALLGHRDWSPDLKDSLELALKGATVDEIHTIESTREAP